MAKAKDKRRETTPDLAQMPRAPHRLPEASGLGRALGVEAPDLLGAQLSEIGNLLWMPKDASAAEIHVRITRAIELYESLAPEDGAEGMLATQMVGTHFAALECLRRAAHPDQSFAGRDTALKHAQKLMSLYTQQLAALNRHRGRGQQKVTVEHVHVEAGGQAIVGTVEAGHTPPAPGDALEDKGAAPADPPPARKRAKSRRKT